MDEPRPYRITFVCTGNTCRSPMAEVVARQVAWERGMRGLTVGSAGTHAWDGQPASEGARDAVRELGLDLESHASTLLTAQVVAESDLLLCMTGSHVASVRALGGEGRCELLTTMAHDPDDDGDADQPNEVSDPFGGSREVYVFALAHVERLVRVMLADGGPVARGMRSAQDPPAD